MQIVQFGGDSITRWIDTAARDTMTGQYRIVEGDSIRISWEVGSVQTGTQISFAVSHRGEQLTLTASNGTKLYYKRVE